MVGAERGLYDGGGKQHEGEFVRIVAWPSGRAMWSIVVVIFSTKREPSTSRGAVCI